MVRYTLPTAILALSVGAWGSDTATPRMKGAVLNSDGGSNGQQVPDFYKKMKESLRLRQNGNGKGNNGNGNGNGGSNRTPDPEPTPVEPNDPASTLPADTIILNGQPFLFPASEMIETVDQRDITQAEQGHASQSGCAGSDFVRGAEGSAYEDGISLMKENNPSARAVSNAFHSDENIPNGMRASDWLWQWGQFVDHDYALGPETGEEMDIDIPEGDEFYPAEFDHFETERTQAQFDIHGVLQQENVITSYIDAGNVYGNTLFRMEVLKANDGSGRMRTSEGNLLPLAGDDEAVQELTARFGDSRNVVEIPRSEFFLAGEFRVNEHVNLITVHTLMHREHNYWADIIRAGNPDLSEDKVFAYARVIVQAEVQKITYDEFLALLLGEDGIPPYEGFNPEVDAGTLNLGAACAFRIGHTLISPSISFVDASGTANVVPFADGFWNPNLHKDGGMDGFLRGLQTQVCQEVDVHMQSTLRNNLDAVRDDVPPRDLYALNVLRAREHGIPNYNDIRRAYLGEDSVLPSGTDSFSDPSVFLPEAGAILESIYDGPDSVDCFPGLLAEPHVPGAMVGETHLAVLSKQFGAIRDGDEFWYQNRLEGDLLAMIEATTLAQIIKRNSDEPGSLDDLPDNAFIVPE